MLLALTTLATLKSELLEDPSDTSQDAVLTRAILSATARVESLLGRHLCYQEGIEQIEQDQSLQRRIVLDARPVREVTRVDFVADDGELTEIEPDQWVLEKNAYLMRRFGSWFDQGRTRWPDVQSPVFKNNSRACYKITYNAGYYGPNQEDPGAAPPIVRDLPYDLEQAALLLAKSTFLNKDSDFRLVREHVLEAANWFDNSSLDKEVERLLKPYRGVRMSR